MKTSRVWPLALLLLGALSPEAAQSCSRVLSNSNGQSVVVGRTMDLYLDDKAALVLRPVVWRPVDWSALRWRTPSAGG